MDVGLLWTKWSELNAVSDDGVWGWAEWTQPGPAHTLEYCVKKAQAISSTENTQGKIQQRHKYEANNAQMLSLYSHQTTKKKLGI